MRQDHIALLLSMGFFSLSPPFLLLSQPRLAKWADTVLNPHPRCYDIVQQRYGTDRRCRQLSMTGLVDRLTTKFLRQWRRLKRSSINRSSETCLVRHLWLSGFEMVPKIKEMCRASIFFFWELSKLMKNSCRRRR